MTYSLPSLIERACSQSRFDPNIAIDIEICDLINKKQGSAPRIAALAIVRLVNSTKVNQSLLALTLLDSCVKNCGYPFHLQIASKEFLNALVRRFPERPPARYAPTQPLPENQWNHFDYVPPQQFVANPVIDKILYLIKEWKVALAELAKYRADMGYIKDMYRLLKMKGYQFPELKDASVSVLIQNKTLKSVSELEEEDRIEKSAKLQELIRRGRPQDLIEANKLMQIMTGYDEKHQVNFKEQFSEELHKILNKARLLYELLDKLTTTTTDVVMDELKKSCEDALSKIKNLLKDENDDDKIEELEEGKSIVKGAILKYQDVKQGRFDTKYDLSGKFRSDKEDFADKNVPTQPISLIDLDDDQTVTTQNKNDSYNDLSSIFGANLNLSNTLNHTSANIFDLLDSNVSSTSHSVSSSAFSSPQMSSSSINKTIELVNKNGLNIQFDVNISGTTWKLQAYYSNKSTAPMDKIILLLATPKSMEIKMGPVSSESVPPKSNKLVTQSITINNPNKETLRLRYKVTYEQFGVDMEQSGEYHE